MFSDVCSQNLMKLKLKKINEKPLVSRTNADQCVFLWLRFEDTSLLVGFNWLLNEVSSSYKPHFIDFLLFHFLNRKPFQNLAIHHWSKRNKNQILLKMIIRVIINHVHVLTVSKVFMFNFFNQDNVTWRTILHN